MGWIAALIMGFVLGLVGGGGGILTVPILVTFFGLGATVATGGSLFVVGVTSGVAAVHGLIHRQSEVKAALLLAIPSMFAAFTARKLVVPAIPDPVLGIPKDDLLLGSFALLMIVVAMAMFRRKDAPSVKTTIQPAWVVLISLGIGLLSGTLGAGGGFLILPVLILVLGVEPQRAIATSLLVITIQSFGGLVGELGQPRPWSQLAWIALVAVGGMVPGAMLRAKLPGGHLQRAFAWLVLGVAFFLLSKLFLNRF